MGLFDWFQRVPACNVAELDDLIWLSKPAKFNGVKQAISESLAEPERPAAIILVAHFRDCLSELEKIVASVSASCPITVASSASLTKARAPAESFGNLRSVGIVVGERHPLLSHDEAILEFAKSLPCRCFLVHHVSLEDPTVRALAGEWVGGVLKRLGMSEGETIESKMVARRLRDAHKKFSNQCLSDLSADSAEEWLERNCPARAFKGQR